MSENVKKPGTRDISDLKARLGLKKGGEAAGRQGGGVPPPNASKIGGAFVPPPPGVAPPQPAQPAIPDASVDPFGAMNAMARQGAVTAAPEIIVVNDGKPVEEVSDSHKFLAKLKIALIAIVPLIVGYIFGGINHANNAWNKTVDDAGRVFTDFSNVGKSLQTVQDTLDQARDRGKGEVRFDDAELTDALINLKLQAPDPNLLFHSNMYNLEATVVAQLFGFYADLGVLYGKINTHVAYAKRDQKKTYRKNDAVAKIGSGNFGAVIRLPADKSPPAVELVEIVAPYCAGTPAPPECPPEQFAGFTVRSVVDGQQAKIPWSKDPAALAADHLVLLKNDDANPKEIIDAIFAGAENFVDYYGFKARMAEIEESVKNLSETRKILQDKLNVEKNQSKRFAL